MSVTDIFPKEKEEKVGTLFYRMAIRRLLRKWLGRMLRSRELRTPRREIRDE